MKAVAIHEQSLEMPAKLAALHDRNGGCARFRCRTSGTGTADDLLRCPVRSGLPKGFGELNEKNSDAQAGKIGGCRRRKIRILPDQCAERRGAVRRAVGSMSDTIESSFVRSPPSVVRSPSPVESHDGFGVAPVTLEPRRTTGQRRPHPGTRAWPSQRWAFDAAFR